MQWGLRFEFERGLGVEFTRWGKTANVNCRNMSNGDNRATTELFHHTSSSNIITHPHASSHALPLQHTPLQHPQPLPLTANSSMNERSSGPMPKASSYLMHMWVLMLPTMAFKTEKRC